MPSVGNSNDLWAGDEAVVQVRVPDGLNLSEGEVGRRVQEHPSLLQNATVATYREPLGIDINAVRAMQDAFNAAEVRPVASRPRPRVDSSSVEDQQEVAKRVLDAIQLCCPLAVVAGGAVRDWMLDTPARDIDVWMNILPHMSVDETVDHVLDLLESACAGTELHSSWMSTDSNYVFSEGVKGVYKICIDDVPFDIVFIEGDPSEVLRTFPYSFTQADWDGEEFDTTPEFDLFLQTGAILTSHVPCNRYTEKCRKYAEEQGWTFEGSAKDVIERLANSLGLELNDD